MKSISVDVLQMCSSVYVVQLARACACVRVSVCDTLFMGMAAGVMYMMLSNYCFRNVYAYFLCRLVCTGIYESDAELTFMCFS